MSFLAGAVATEGGLGPDARRRFLAAADAMGRELPWRLSRREGPRHAFAWGGFGEMWEGPAAAALPECDAAGAGVQWCAVPGDGALAHLSRAFLSGRPPGNHFDRFVFAAVGRGDDRAVVATDPVGAGLVFYALREGAAVFSTHQLFLREFLGPDAAWDRDGAMEYLLLGHNVGAKTLLEGVGVLPAGGLLSVRGGRAVVSRYARFDDVEIMRGIGVDAAADLLLSHLAEKAQGYASLARRPFAVFLSGGFDSRLTLCALSATGRVAAAYTTQQNTRFGGRIVSEKEIARELSRALGVRNRYTAPVVGTNARRTRLMDYESWFNGWAFEMADRVPSGRYVLTDGLAACFILCKTHIVTGESACVDRGDREGFVGLIHARHLRGYNDHTPGIDRWRDLVDPGFLEGFSRRLRGEIAAEVHDVRCEEFVSPYLIRNRVRRAGGTLPRLIFGRRGDVVTPFCDVGYRRLLLSIPYEYSYDMTLPTALLKRIAPPPPPLPTTHAGDSGALAPYLVDSFPPETGWDRAAMTLRRAFRRRPPPEPDIFEDPPRALAELLAPSMKRALRAGDREFIGRHAPAVNLIRCLDRFLAGGGTGEEASPWRS